MQKYILFLFTLSLNYQLYSSGPAQIADGTIETLDGRTFQVFIDKNDKTKARLSDGNSARLVCHRSNQMLKIAVGPQEEYLGEFIKDTNTCKVIKTPAPAVDVKKKANKK